MNLISTINCSFSKLQLQKIKIFLLLTIFSVSSFNVFTQTSVQISTCSDFVVGPSAWPYVLVATTVDSGVVSQGSQTFTLNVTSLPAGGANFRVYKTVANGNAFFGNPIALTLGSNTITVAAVSFDRAVKFQFSSGAVEFDALSLNGIASNCVGTLPPPTSVQISTCSDFVAGPSAWPYVLVATTVDSGVVSQGSQTFTLNVTSLPAGGANFRVYKTVANGNAFFGNPIALTLGSNTITVAAVSFDRAVKFQFSSGAVEFDALSLNGVASNCVCSTISYTSDVVEGCDSYTWIDGNTYTSSNNTATYTLMNSAGCDSVVTLDLTINNSTTASISDTACDSYTWSGIVYTVSGIYTHVYTNAVGCDSVVTLDLTINNLTTVSISDTACDSYTWSGTVYTVSGIYTNVYTNVVGCDSVVTLDLIINNSSTSSTNVTACDSYDWNGSIYTSSGSYTWIGTNADGCDSVASLVLTLTGNSTLSNISSCEFYTWNGNTYFNSGTYIYNNGSCIDSLILIINNTSSSSTTISACDSFSWNGYTYLLSGTYTWVGTNTVGCDSTATLNLIINNTSSSNTNISACDSYDWNGNTYTSSGTYTWTGTNADGCDSLANLDLTINSSSFVTDIVAACDSFAWIDGNTYFSSNNTATHTLINGAGCDSLVTLDLTITNINTAVVVVDDSTLQVQSFAAGTMYQWVDCNDNFAPIAGEINPTFTTQNPGYYAVEVTLNNCSLLSDCFTITIETAIDILDSYYGIQLFPNPTKNDLTLSLEGIDVVDIVVLDVQGKVLCQSVMFDQERINLSSYVAGTYFVKIITPAGTRKIRVTKH